MTQLNGDLLTPIPGANPAGAWLRYDPLYDQIKEARREDEDLPQGDWQTTRKAADWPLVVKLATDALSKKTKDLQIAAWLTEAWLRREGIGGLQRGLVLLLEMLQQYWDTVYPEIDDGDAEMRAAPLEWLGLRFDLPIRRTALNQDGHSLLDYRDARTVPTQAEADDSSDQREKREQAIAEGRLTQEEFERGFQSTPKAWYRQLVTDIDASLDALTELDAFCSERFQDARPSFSPMRVVLQEVRQVAAQLLGRKLEEEPDPPGTSTSVEPAVADPPGSAAQPKTPGASAPAPAAAAGSVNLAAGPRDREEAALWITAAARQLRQDRPADPAPYLMLRGFRWGELRAGGGRVDPRLLAAPPTHVRTGLKTMLLDADWPQLLAAAEDVMAQPFGRGWLDLQRYVLTATDGLGSEYEHVGAAIRGALRTLLQDVPDLLSQTLMDDSPTANAETLAWMRSERLLPEGDDTAPPADDGRAPVSRRDPYEVATARVRAGDARGAMELLMREAAQEKSARARFLRRSQAAEIMVAAGMEPVALPILRDMLMLIEQHRLEEWEAGDAVSQPLALLYRCARRMDAGDVDASALYERICRLDPVRAIQLQGGGGDDEGS